MSHLPIEPAKSVAQAPGKQENGVPPSSALVKQKSNVSLFAGTPCWWIE